MTRFEILQTFARDGKTEARHLALFHVLSEMWVSDNRPEVFEPDVDEVARLLRIGYSTAMRWINELERFGYIELRRGRNQHEKSTLAFKVGGTSTETARHEMRQHNGQQGSEVMRELRQHDVKQDGTASTEPADTGLSMRQTAIPGNEGSVNDSSNSAQPFFVHNINHLVNNSSIVSKDKVPGDDYVKGVQGKKQNQSVERSVRRDRYAGAARHLPVCKFADSPLADIEKFRDAFSTDTTAKAADLDHYHARLLNWRDKKGNVPERADWLATAKTFLLNDYREGKLVTITTVKPLPNASPRNHPRSAVIEPESTTGRRFGSW